MNYQTDLNGSLIKPDEIAIQRLIDHEPKEGYYLAFSGGKDSIVCYDLAVKAGIKFDAHYSMTTVDPPEVTRYIKEYYPDVIWEKPRNSMFKLIEKKGMVPTRMARFCCEELKEIGGKNRIVITGIRWEESRHRAEREVFEQSKRVKSKWFLNPIIDWKTSEIWEYIKNNEIPYCSLYDQGKTRIGCIMCPLQGTKGMIYDAIHYPKFYNAYLKAIERMMIKKEKAGDPFKKFDSPEAVMYWWIHNADYDGTEQQSFDYFKEESPDQEADLIGGIA